jgi:hypothetical protein
MKPQGIYFNEKLVDRSTILRSDSIVLETLSECAVWETTIEVNPERPISNLPRNEGFAEEDGILSRSSGEVVSCSKELRKSQPIDRCFYSSLSEETVPQGQRGFGKTTLAFAVTTALSHILPAAGESVIGGRPQSLPGRRNLAG